MKLAYEKIIFQSNAYQLMLAYLMYVCDAPKPALQHTYMRHLNQ